MRSPEQRQTTDDDAPIRLSISVSPKMSEMSSTGRDSKVNMVVADAEVGDSWDSTYHANQFLSSHAPPLVAVGHVCSFIHVPSESRLALGISGMEEMGGTSCV